MFLFEKKLYCWQKTNCPKVTVFVKTRTRHAKKGKLRESVVRCGEIEKYIVAYSERVSFLLCVRVVFFFICEIQQKYPILLPPVLFKLKHLHGKSLVFVDTVDTAYRSGKTPHMIVITTAIYSSTSHFIVYMTYFAFNSLDSSCFWIVSPSNPQYSLS